MIIKAIKNLRPTSSFSLMGDTYDTLIWQDDKTNPPSKEEVDAEIIKVEAQLKATAYIAKRAAEYPPITDYIDGVVKGDQAQIDKYIADCLAVKAKYPKGAA
jgi:hypothetical protein